MCKHNEKPKPDCWNINKDIRVQTLERWSFLGLPHHLQKFMGLFGFYQENHQKMGDVPARFDCQLVRFIVSSKPCLYSLPWLLPQSPRFSLENPRKHFLVMPSGLANLGSVPNWRKLGWESWLHSNPHWIVGSCWKPHFGWWNHTFWWSNHHMIWGHNLIPAQFLQGLSSLGAWRTVASWVWATSSPVGPATYLHRPGIWWFKHQTWFQNGDWTNKTGDLSIKTVDLIWISHHKRWFHHCSGRSNLLQYR